MVSAMTIPSSSMSLLGTSNQTSCAPPSVSVSSIDCPNCFLAVRENFHLLQSYVRRHRDRFIAPRTTAEVDTTWQTFCFLIEPGSGVRRADLQQFLEEYGISTRTVWTGNATRQPMMRNATFRQPTAGMPNADRVFEYGMLVPSGPSMTDEDVEYICNAFDLYFDHHGDRV